MKKLLFTTTVLVMLMALPAAAQVVFDSSSMDPPYVQAGNDVNIYLKFHEGFTKRSIYEVKTINQERLPVGEDPSIYYVTKLKAKDEAAAQYVLIVEGDKTVGHLFKGETWTTPTKVHISDNAPATNFTMTFEVYRRSTNNTNMNEIILSQDVQIQVNGEPKFMINSDSDLNAGQTKDFKIAIGNVGGGVARLVTVSLNATTPLTVLGSSSTYAGDVPQNTFRNFGYQLYVDSTAEPKAYTMPFEIKYTDRTGQVQTITKMLGVKVQGAPQVMASLDSFDDLKGGMTGKVTISIANNGFVEAKFLSMNIADTDQYTVTSKNNVYIGNLASDDFQSEDFKIQLKDGVSGKVPLKINVVYTEENNNQQHSVDSDIMLNVMTAEEYEKAHPSTNGNQQLTYVLIGIPALIMAYIVLWVLIKVVGALTSVIDKKIFRKQQ